MSTNRPEDEDDLPQSRFFYETYKAPVTPEEIAADNAARQKREEERTRTPYLVTEGMVRTFVEALRNTAARYSVGERRDVALALEEVADSAEQFLLPPR
jgi:hypothetical protein